MGALTNISKSGSASLEVVAGPIGEALVATAFGIAVAVPAVVAYNFFIRRNKVVWSYLDNFVIDFVHLALKSAFIIDLSAHHKDTASSAGKTPTSISSKKSVIKPVQEDLVASEAHA
jgi:biopolymer transport protein ExbB